MAISHSIDTFNISSKFQVLVNEQELCWNSRIIDTVNNIWSEAQNSKVKLFDSLILGVASVNETTAICHRVPYRFFFAQLNKPEIHQELKLAIIAVSGLLISKSSLVFGRRGKQVTQYPSWLELVPSGSLDVKNILEGGIADYRKQLLDELSEEVGISQGAVLHIAPLLIVFDKQMFTYDICCRISVSEATMARLSSVSSSGYLPAHNEYEAFKIILLPELKAFVDQHKSEIIPTSLAILQHQQLI